jgi:hypothetical protein
MSVKLEEVKALLPVDAEMYALTEDVKYLILMPEPLTTEALHFLGKHLKEEFHLKVVFVTGTDVASWRIFELKEGE